MAQDYDKIIKENLQVSIPSLAQTLLGLEIKKMADVELKLQYTLEREPDFLQRVIHADPMDNYALQIEFQTSNETKHAMLGRCMVYMGMIYRKYKLPTLQYVIYIGDDEPRIETEMITPQSRFSIGLIDLKKVDHQLFLQSSRPQEVIFAILADYNRKNPAALLKNIVNRLRMLESSELELSKYYKQLRIISNLRNLDELTVKTLNDMPILIDVKKDVLFKQGLEKGLEQGIEQGIQEGEKSGEIRKENIGIINMLLYGDSDEKTIALFAGSKVSRVLQLKKAIAATNLQKIVDQYGKIKRLTKKQQEAKKQSLLLELLKIKDLDDKAIAEIAQAKVEEVKRLRAALVVEKKENKKSELNKKSEDKK